MDFRKYPNRIFRHILSIPFIYAPFIAIVILDIVLEIYHRVCFPLYGLLYVKRSNYIKIDRHKLSYLNWIEKINCMYCGYANGFFPYAAEISARTEKYWCGIKHRNDDKFNEPKHHSDFLEYGDDKAFKEKYK